MTRKQETILAQWQTCVEMANSVSQRRDSMNNLFMTVNLALVAALSYMGDVKSILLVVAGIVVCGVWRILLRNFRLLNAEKFEAINRIEKELLM